MYEYYSSMGGLGLEIVGPDGSCFLQGDEASQLHDELESLESDEQIQMVLSQYENILSEGN